MAICNAVKSGNWSDPTVWDVVPQSGDTVRCGNYVVTIDVDVDIGTGTLQCNGSGQFRVTSAPRTITANIASVSGAAALQDALLCSHTSGTVTINGNVTGGSGDYCYGCQNASTGALVINGTVVSGTGQSSYGLRVVGNGNVTVTRIEASDGYASWGCSITGSGTVTIGTVCGSASWDPTLTAESIGVYVNANCTLYVTNATGGSAGSAYGVYVSANCTLYVTNATGGSGSGAYGVYVNAACNATVQTATGGLGGSGVYAASNGCVVYDAYPNAFGNGSLTTYAAGVSTAHNAYVKVRRAHCNQYGAWPIAGRAYVDETIYPDYTVQVYDKDGQSHTMIEPNGSADYPDESDVRFGVSYDNGDFVGSCHVPTPAQVASGVPVDNTVGTAVLLPAAVGDAVWDEARADHTTSGTYGNVSEWAGGSGGGNMHIPVRRATIAIR